MYNYRKLILVAFSVCCLIAILTCVIVNVAIDRQITWSAYPIISVPLGWLVLTPLLVRKHGVVLSICSLMVFTIPFLFLIEKITPGGSWFLPIGIPSAIAGAITVWAVYLLFRFLRINMWYKSAIAVFFVGVVTSPAINYFVDIYLYTKPMWLSTILEIASCVAVSALLFSVGFMKSKAKETTIQAAN